MVAGSFSGREIASLPSARGSERSRQTDNESLDPARDIRSRGHDGSRHEVWRRSEAQAACAEV